MEKKAKPLLGRPSLYTEELADRICEIVATNPQGLPTLCKKFEGLPTAETIRVWRWEKPLFSAKYAEAKRFQAEILAESIEDITDDLSTNSYQDENGITRIDSGIVAVARLIVDSRKWTASKLAPKIYGDKRQPEETSSADTLSKIQSLVADLNKTNSSDI
jgi:hypothetical protein